MKFKIAIAYFFEVINNIHWFNFSKTNLSTKATKQKLKKEEENNEAAIMW